MLSSHGLILILGSFCFSGFNVNCTYSASAIRWTQLPNPNGSTFRSKTPKVQVIKPQSRSIEDSLIGVSNRAYRCQTPPLKSQGIDINLKKSWISLNQKEF